MMYQKLEKKNAGTGSGSASSSSSGRLAGAGFNHVVAVAGRDNVITIWPAAADRPVVVLRDVFQQPPSDFSWSIDGFALVVSGHDGTVIVLRFSPEDLGHPVPEVRYAFSRERRGGGEEGLRSRPVPMLVLS